MTVGGITNGRWQGRVDEKLEQQADDIAEIKHTLQEMRDEYVAQRRLDAEEKKADFRWKIGTTLAIIATILTAAGIVATHL